MLAGCTGAGDGARPLELDSRAVGFSRTDPGATAAGKLRFRGGLELRSADPDFGGLSALVVTADGASFVAVSDRSHWVTGTLEYRDGDLVGAVGGTIAPLLDPDGRPLVDKKGDAEGLASAEEGSLDELFVSFEGAHRVWRYPFGRHGVEARAVNFPLPPEALKAPNNGGLEGITRVGDGELFAVSEHYRNRADNYRAWLLPFVKNGTAATSAPERPPTPRAIVPVPPYALTDVRQLPDGDLLTLERRYDPVQGVGIELRRLPWKRDDSLPNRPLDGEVIARLDTSYELDNMEGLSIRREEGGRTLVYLLSDDNFNRPIQRTLLMMFELVP
jgi:hypothetical protein